MEEELKSNTTDIKLSFDAVLFNSTIEANVDQFIYNMPLDNLQEFMDELSNPDFGQEGHYTFYCKHCGRQWNFTNKDKRQLFERFHRQTGCSLEYVDKDLSVKRKTDNILIRNHKNVSDLAKNKIQEQIDRLTKKIEERDAEHSKRDMPEEQPA